MFYSSFQPGDVQNHGCDAWCILLMLGELKAQLASRWVHSVSLWLWSLNLSPYREITRARWASMSSRNSSRRSTAGSRTSWCLTRTEVEPLSLMRWPKPSTPWVSLQASPGALMFWSPRVRCGLMFTVRWPGYRLSPQALNAVMKRYSKGGRIFFDDYVACCVKLRSVTGT